MHLLQFSTSHYCRKARLGLGYQQMSYTVENLTPGLHRLKLAALTGTATLPVLLPQRAGDPAAIADSTDILAYLDAHGTQPLLPTDPQQRQQAQQIEDWLDESIGTATRFVYYHYRAGAGKAIDPSLLSQVVIQVVRRQYGITATTAAMAAQRLNLAISWLDTHWRDRPYLVGETLSVADIAAAALLSPLALLPQYQADYPWLFAKIAAIHQDCGEPLPPGLSGRSPTAATEAIGS